MSDISSPDEHATEGEGRLGKWIRRILILVLLLLLGYLLWRLVAPVFDGGSAKQGAVSGAAAPQGAPGDQTVVRILQSDGNGVVEAVQVRYGDAVFVTGPGGAVYLPLENATSATVVVERSGFPPAILSGTPADGRLDLTLPADARVEGTVREIANEPARVENATAILATASGTFKTPIVGGKYAFAHVPGGPATIRVRANVMANVRRQFARYDDKKVEAILAPGVTNVISITVRASAVEEVSRAIALQLDGRPQSFKALTYHYSHPLNATLGCTHEQVLKTLQRNSKLKVRTERAYIVRALRRPTIRLARIDPRGPRNRQVEPGVEMQQIRRMTDGSTRVGVIHAGLSPSGLADAALDDGAATRGTWRIFPPCR